MTDPKSTVPGSENNSGGYGNPPKDHQWKSGQSGNPAGKKKGAKNIGEIFRRVANRVVAIANGNRTKKATMMELLMAAPMTHGIKGDAANAALGLELIEKFGMQPAAREDEQEEDVIYFDWAGKPKVNIRLDREKLMKEDRKLSRLISKHDANGPAIRAQLLPILLQMRRDGVPSDVRDPS